MFFIKSFYIFLIVQSLTFRKFPQLNVFLFKTIERGTTLAFLDLVSVRISVTGFSFLANQIKVLQAANLSRLQNEDPTALAVPSN